MRPSLFSTTAALLLLVPVLAQAGFEASSHRKDGKRGDNYWNATSALDGKLESCWMINAEDANEGQWIQLDVPSSTVDKLSLVVGWAATEADFKDYSRLKKARVEIFDFPEGDVAKVVASQEITLEDKATWQTIDLPDTKVGGPIRGGRVRLTVLETYPGTDFANLALSELRVLLKEFPVEAMILKEVPPAVSGEDKLDDNNPKTVFVADPGVANPEFLLSGAGYGLSSVQVVPGAKGTRRIKTVEVLANGLTLQHTLEDKWEPQHIPLPAMIGYTGSTFGDVRIKVVDTYEGTGGIALGELRLMAATIEDF